MLSLSRETTKCTGKGNQTFFLFQHVTCRGVLFGKLDGAIKSDGGSWWKGQLMGGPINDSRGSCDVAFLTRREGSKGTAVARERALATENHGASVFGVCIWLHAIINAAKTTDKTAVAGGNKRQERERESRTSAGFVPWHSAGTRPHSAAFFFTSFFII